MKNNLKKIDLYRLLALLVIFSGIFYFYANIFAPRFIPEFIRIGVVRRPTTLLILGTDINFSSETGQALKESNGRTDAIMLLRVDPINYRVYLLSIPRDSYVNIPGYGWAKINAANVYGGVDLLEKTLEQTFGIEVDNYLKINPSATGKLIDLVGGVDVYVENNMYYVDRAQGLYINLKKGWHKLNGKEAQGYMRFRHDAFGDIGRIGRQQQMLSTVFMSLTKPSNLLKAPLAFQLATSYIQTNLPLLKIIRLANFARTLSARDVITYLASGETQDNTPAGSVWLVDKRGLDVILKAHFGR
ncbi:MAG: LCP family protein [Candidatus Margulisiibacteriota bacterium]